MLDNKQTHTNPLSSKNINISGFRRQEADLKSTLSASDLCREIVVSFKMSDYNYNNNNQTRFFLNLQKLGKIKT